MLYDRTTGDEYERGKWVPLKGDIQHRVGSWVAIY